MALSDIPPFSGEGDAEDASSANGTIKRAKPATRYSSRLVNHQRQKNDHGSPISRLPVELMCRIFFFVRDGSIYRLLRNIGSWAWVSHVCHRWRAIALGEPALWTDPPLHVPEWTRLCLERSKQAGLIVELRADTPLEVIGMVSQHVSHISKLTVRCGNLNLMAAMLVAVLRASAPLLETISLEYWKYSSGTPLADLVHPDDILAGFVDAPRLRHLKLHCLSLRWDSPLLSSLTSLDLDDVPPALRPSMAQLRAILESTPKLKLLKLCNTLPQSTHPVTGGANYLNRVDLPYLETLALTGTLPLLLQFSDMVALSANIGSINITVEHTGEFKVDRLVADLTEAYRDEYYLSRVSLERFSSETLDPVELVFHSDEESNRCPYTGERTARLKVSLNTNNKSRGRFNVDEIMEDYEAIYAPFFQCFSWDDLVEFRMNCLPTDALPSARVVASTFGSLRGVKEVVVSSSTVHLLMEILRPTVNGEADGRVSYVVNNADSADGTARTDASVPFPGLRHLHLVHVTVFSRARTMALGVDSPDLSPADKFSADEDETDPNANTSHEPAVLDNADSEHHWDEEEDDEDIPVDIDEFLKCLAGRKRQGAPIRRLDMVNCTVVDEDMQALRGAVAKIEWEEFPVRGYSWLDEDYCLDPFSR